LGLVWEKEAANINYKHIARQSAKAA